MLIDKKWAAGSLVVHVLTRQKMQLKDNWKKTMPNMKNELDPQQFLSCNMLDHTHSLEIVYNDETGQKGANQLYTAKWHKTVANCETAATYKHAELG